MNIQQVRNFVRGGAPFNTSCCSQHGCTYYRSGTEIQLDADAERCLANCIVNRRASFKVIKVMEIINESKTD